MTSFEFRSVNYGHERIEGMSPILDIHGNQPRSFSNMIVMIAVSLVLLLFIPPQVYAQELVIHCINVGQGDCTLIESPSGKRMMVDNGRSSYSDELIAYLDTIGVNHINWLVTTHYHADHIGGTNPLVQHGVQIDSVFDREWSYCTQTYDTYASVVGSIRHTVEDGRVFDLGNGVTSRVVSVNGNGLLTEPYIAYNCPGGDSTDENDFSVAMVITYGGFEFFVGGDLPGTTTGYHTDIETSVAAEVGDIEVYQVNHHGSNTSSNQYFLDMIDPEVSIISVGSNGYGHPHPSTVQRLLATSVIYQTGDAQGNIVDGDIVIRTDGLILYTVNGDTFIIDPLWIAPINSANVPNLFILYGNYPNPFNSRTTIEYGLPVTSIVTVEIFDLLGRRTKTLLNEEQPAGYHQIRWDAANKSSGIYFYRIKAEGFEETRKMIFLK